MGEGGVEEEQAFGGQVQPANPSANNPLHTFTLHKLMMPMLVFSVLCYTKYSHLLDNNYKWGVRLNTPI